MVINLVGLEWGLGYIIYKEKKFVKNKMGKYNMEMFISNYNKYNLILF